MLAERHPMELTANEKAVAKGSQMQLFKFSCSVYTRLVTGEETLSSTKAFNRRHAAVRSATTSSFI
jgi:hypothetical protein